VHNVHKSHQSIISEEEKEIKEEGTAFPPELDTEKFRAAWAEWQRYRREIKRRLTPMTVKKQLAQLADWGPDQAIIAIETSIAKGWQGLFEPKSNGNRAPGLYDGLKEFVAREQP
jgi:hypothetical protein